MFKSEIMPSSTCIASFRAYLSAYTAKNGVTDRHNEAPKVQMPRWIDIISTNTTIHHSTNTATADACIQDFCTAITMQCFSYAIRSQSVLTTIQLGVSTVFTCSTAHAYHERDSFHSLPTRFLWTCAAIL